jgi:uncharacterized protein (DUF885 family)
VTESGLYVPFVNFPSQVSEEQRADFTARGVELIETRVIPGYQELLDFYLSEYLPACRQTVGITSLDGGRDYYEYVIRYYTTTDMSPDEIHQLGLAEVERIRGEMDEIIRQVGFEGDFRAFLDYLRTEPRFYAQSESELLGRAALISKTAEGLLPKYFGLLPRGTYSIKANPTRGTFYQPSSGDGTTSGTYFLGVTRWMRSACMRRCPAITCKLPWRWSSKCRSSDGSFITQPTVRVGVCTPSSWVKRWGCTRTPTVTLAG